MENNKNNTYKPSNASKKLRNIETIQKMLDGTHKSQTKKTVGYTNDQQVKREIGERWTDSAGVTWEQKNGYRVKGIDRLERAKEVSAYLHTNQACPECGNAMVGRLDKKYFNIHARCMDCSIILENNMKIAGTWKEYERKRVLANVKSWIKDAEIEKALLIEQIAKNYYVNNDGSLEKWDLPYNVIDQQNRIEQGFIKFKKQLLIKYNATPDELLELGIVDEETNETDTSKNNDIS